MRVTSLKNKITIVGVWSLLMILSAACDTVNTNDTTQPEFEVVNDLESRIQAEQGNQKVNVQGATLQNLTVSLSGQVNSPTVRDTTTRASSLTYNANSDRLYIGYKIQGDEFGGGIDILDVSDVNNLSAPPASEVSAVQSENMDVQEVDYNETEGALYVAGALVPKKDGVSPSRLSKLEFNGNNFNQEDQALSGNVAKSLVAQAGAGNSNGRVHVIDDEKTLYQFDLDLGSKRTLQAEETAEFRSIAQMNTGNGSNGNPLIFVLDHSGKLYSTNQNGFNSLDEVGNNVFPVGGLGDSGNQIARLEAHPEGSPPMLFAALNQHGYGAFNPSGNSTWKVDTDNYVVSISAQKLENTWRLYVAGPKGTIEVYDDNFQGQNTGNKIGEFDLSEISGVEQAQVNQVLAIKGKLFVAYGKGGVLVLDISEN